MASACAEAQKHTHKEVAMYNLRRQLGANPRRTGIALIIAGLLIWFLGIWFFLKVGVALAVGFGAVKALHAYAPHFLATLEVPLQLASNGLRFGGGMARGIAGQYLPIPRVALPRVLPTNPLARMKAWGALAGLFLVFGFTSYGLLSFVLILAGFYGTGSALLNGGRAVKQLTDASAVRSSTIDIEVR